MLTDAHIRRVGEPTAKGDDPVCARHPDERLRWRENGWGWRCQRCHDAGEATPQPYAYAGGAVGLVVPPTPKQAKARSRWGMGRGRNRRT